MLRTREPTRHCFNGRLAQTNRVYRIRRQGVTKANPVADSLSALPYFAWCCLISSPPSLHLAFMHLEHCWFNLSSSPLSCKANPVLAAQQPTSTLPRALLPAATWYRRTGALALAALQRTERETVTRYYGPTCPNFCFIIQTKVFWMHKIFWKVSHSMQLCNRKRVTGVNRNILAFKNVPSIIKQTKAIFAHMSNFVTICGINIFQQHRDF